MVTSVGEMRDLIACLNIFNGADPKAKPETMDFFNMLEVN